jgi:CPA2 family monovalent cation:H+ antiporter-2
MFSHLEPVLLLLAVAVVGVAIFRVLHLPPMLGYLTVGILIGPHALGLVGDDGSMRGLAEFGVVFLMFSIGLEFSLPQLMSIRRLVFGLGLAQVIISIVVVVVACMAGAYLLPRLSGLTWQTAFAISGVMALSSTAIVSKMLAERMELETEHGRRIFGILLFQDLAVVPLLILIPALATNPKDLWPTLALAAGKAVIVLLLLLFIGQKLMRRWFHVVVKRQSQELFMLNLLLVTLGSAWITEIAGLSLELGAFVAGMLISETRYKHQVEADIQAFRDVLLGLFFITIGMLLNVHLVLEYWWIVLLLLVVPFLFKLGLITVLAKFFGASFGVSLRTGLALAQAGEFGFVLLNQASGLNLIEPLFAQVLLASMVLSMMAAPFIIAKSDWIVMKMAANEWMTQSLALTRIASRTLAAQEHVIIAGFGRTGQSMAKLLDDASIPYMALDLDPERVREAEAAGLNVVYGDASRRESLVAAGIHRASALVVSFAKTPTALKVLHFAHELAPNLPAVVRSFDDADFDLLKAGGATEVVPEAIESSLMLASHVLALMGLSQQRIAALVQAARSGRYASLRGYFHGVAEDGEGAGLRLRLHTVRLPEGARAAGSKLDAYDFSTVGAEVVLVRRGRRRMGGQRSLVLQPGDVLVLRGTAASVSEAEAMLLR